MQKLGVSSISFLESNRGRVVKISDDEFIYSPFPNTPRFLPGSGVCMRSIHAKNSSHDTERLQATHLEISLSNLPFVLFYPIS